MWLLGGLVYIAFVRFFYLNAVRFFEKRYSRKIRLSLGLFGMLLAPVPLIGQAILFRGSIVAFVTGGMLAGFAWTVSGNLLLRMLFGLDRR